VANGRDASPEGTATLTNTIVAGNTGGDVFGSFAGTNNLIGGDPGLAPLADNGGPTRTMALLPGSAAIDAGTATGAPSTDQRGFGRVGPVDIGAFEVQTKAPSTTTVTGGTFTYDGTAHAGAGAVDVPGGVVALYYEGINGTNYSAATAPTNAGTYTVTATYAGDETHEGSTASADLTILPKRLQAFAWSPGTINLGKNGSIELNIAIDAGQLHGTDTIFDLFNGATFTIAVQNADGSVTHGTLTTVATVESDGSITVSMKMDDSLKADLYDAYLNGRAVNFNLTAISIGGNYWIDEDTMSKLLNKGALQFVL
jgi:hypothetical protein